jgi:spore coat protein U-like protein
MRNLTKILLAAAIAGAAFLAPSVAEAQTANASMTVSATVAKSCVVTGPAAPVNFSAYDPVSAAQQSATGTISVRCVRNTPYSIALTSANGFRMIGTGGNIPYTVLQPNGTTVWSTTALAVPAASVTNNLPINYTATVNPALNADVPVGSYTDTVNVVVTY